MMKKRLLIMSFVVAPAFTVLAGVCACPSPAECVRACPDGASSAKRLWQGIAPQVKNWELGERFAALNRLNGIGVEVLFPQGKFAKPIPVFLYAEPSAVECVPTNELLSCGAAVVWWKSTEGKTDTLKCVSNNSLAMDWMQSRSEFDSKRVMLVGSGKSAMAALETAARDERFALTMAIDMTDCREKPEHLVDLMKLIAPRPLWVSGMDVEHASAIGATRSLYAAYKLPERFLVSSNGVTEREELKNALNWAHTMVWQPFPADSDAIDALIAAAVANGSRSVTLQKNPKSSDGVWRLVRAISVPDNFTLILDGCRLEQPFGVQDNLIRNAGAVEGACQPNRGIRILGQNGATLSMGTRNNYLPRRSGDPNGWRSVGILLCDLTDYEVAGLNFEETQCWAISQERCSHGHVHDIVFGSTDRFFNQDGVDVRKGCHDLVIENIFGKTGDDAVALTAYRDPPGRPVRYGMQIGGNAFSGELDDVYNVTIRHIHAKSMGGHGVIRLLACDGIKMHHITVEDIVDTATGKDKRPQATIRIGDVSYHKMRRCQMGEMHHIFVKGVKASGPKAVWLKGPLCDSEVTDITPTANGYRYDITAPHLRVKLDAENKPR